MPIHDWTRVDAGTFHHFHTTWITVLSNRLNAGLLPEGFYAMHEQHAGRPIADVLTLQLERSPRDKPADEGPADGAIAVAEAPPRVSRKLVAAPQAAYRQLRRTIAIRSTGGHRIVAMIEIVSAGNKDRSTSVSDFVEKAWAAIQHGIHLLIVDLFPPSLQDPGGMHNMIWRRFDSADYEPPAGKPLTAAAYAALSLPEAYVEPLAVGDTLPTMPLFLQANRYINLPLDEPYSEAYQGVPAYWRRVIEGIL